MKVEEIKSADDLEAWLNGLPQEQALRVAPLIAFRAAARLFPFWGSAMEKEWAITHGLSHISMISPLVAAQNLLLNGDYGNLAQAKRAFDRATSAAELTTRVATAPDTNASKALHRIIAFLGFLLKDKHQNDIFSHIVRDLAEIRTVKDWSDAFWAGREEGEFWAAISADINAFVLRPGQNLGNLWPIQTPDWFARADRETRAIWAKDPETWSFWENWWDGLISGTMPFPLELLREVVLIEDGIWQAGPKAVAKRIAGVMEGFALSATYNGERIEVNPPTQKLMLFGEGALPDDLGHYARRKMKRAIDLFFERLSNQYHPLTDAVVTVRTAIENNENIPMELFDACASATRMVGSLARSESIPRPEDDPLIGEFVQILREVAADIIANDPKSQETLARRNAIEGNNALQVSAQVINITVGQIVNVSEGALARELTLNAKDALEKNPESEDARDGAFKLSGRIIRALRVLRESAATFKEFKELYPAAIEILNNPQVQQAVQAILKYLSIG